MPAQTVARQNTLQVRKLRLPCGLGLAATMVRQVLPAVRQDLARWSAAAARCPDPVLRTQALGSIELKRFHCQGGAVLALLAGPRWREAVSFIVALQTISDYLDNLCDRAGQHEVATLRLLHRAMIDAVSGGYRQGSYYLLYPHAADGGYLAGLVGECARLVQRWRVPRAVTDAGVRLVSLYGEMQAIKHGPPAGRLDGLKSWALAEMAGLPAARSLLWNEFSAACGSSLAVFALYSYGAAGTAAGATADTEGCGRLLDAYFPWVCGLHILLDYLIDRREDEAAGDLNFTSYYAGADAMRRRLIWFVERAGAVTAAGGLPGGGFHRSVVEGLLAVYLSDPKAGRDSAGCLVEELLAAAGPGARRMRVVCSALRRLRAV